MNKNILNKIKTKKLKIIKLSEGNIMHVIKGKELKKLKPAEIYFSKVKFGKVKAWKYHKKMSLNLTVPVGNVKFVFYSGKGNKYKVVQIGEKKYVRLIVPPKIWFGFKGLKKPESIILNLANFQHSKKEMQRHKKDKFKFNW